jgi:hypothetical protein
LAVPIDATGDAVAVEGASATVTPNPLKRMFSLET